MYSTEINFPFRFIRFYIKTIDRTSDLSPVKKNLFIVMKILVCISITPDTTAKIAFKNDNTAFNEDGVNFILNPYDEWYALVRALELKEEKGGSVSVINVGPASNETVIRKALAIGADDAYRIDAEATSAFFTASQIAAHAKEAAYDVIFLGKETIDFNGAEVGGMVAELLDVPYISHATKLTYEGDTAILARDIEGGSEILEVAGAYVLSAAKGMAEQRIPNMRGIMMAKRKPLNVIPPVDVTDLSVVSSYTLPDTKASVKMIDPENMDELVKLLYEEAKVL